MNPCFYLAYYCNYFLASHPFSILDEWDLFLSLSPKNEAVKESSGTRSTDPRKAFNANLL